MRPERFWRQLVGEQAARLHARQPAGLDDVDPGLLARSCLTAAGNFGPAPPPAASGLAQGAAVADLHGG
jgi:hypothetical protein